MADALRLQVLFAAVDRLTGPLRAMREGSKGATAALRATQAELGQLKKAQTQIARFKGAEAQLQSMSKQLRAAQKESARLADEILATENPTKKMVAAFEKAREREKALTEQHEKQGRALQDLASGLGAAGVDVSELARHEERLADRVDETTRRLARQKEEVAKRERLRERGEKLKAFGGKVAGVGAAATIGVSTPIIAYFASSIAAAKESAGSIAQVNAALASMGPVAGRSSAQLAMFAGKLQGISLFDDDDILKKVTANTLTFGNVTGKQFDRAQLAAINLSARLGQDLQSSAIQVGKALNDPIKGITALGRVGVQFTEAQKKQIATMVKVGNVAGAQGIILGELAKQFDGAAAAARAAAPDAAARQAWAEFQETTGAILIKTLPPLLTQLTRLLDAFNNLAAGNQATIIVLLAVAAAMGPIITAVGAIISVVGAVSAAFSIGFLPAIALIAAVIVIVVELARGVYYIYKNWGPITAWFGNLWAGITARFTSAFNFLRSLVGAMAQVGRQMLAGLLDALDPVKVAQRLIAIGGRMVSAIKSVLGIKSPSRVFSVIGGYTMQGLAGGLERGTAAPVAALRRAGKLLAASGAVALAQPAIAAATRGPVIDTAPIAASRLGTATQARGAAAGRGGAAPVYNLTIHAQPGQDARAIADEVMRRIEATDRARRDSSYADRD